MLFGGNNILGLVSEKVALYFRFYPTFKIFLLKFKWNVCSHIQFK